MRKRALALSACAFTASVLLARGAAAQSPPAAPETIPVGDWQLAPSMELRARGEYRRDAPDLGGSDGAGSYPAGGAPGVVGPRVRDAWGVFERARVGLGAEHGALSAQLTLQDAHAWGSPIPSGVLGQASRFSQLGAYEAYVEARTASARPWFVKIGRQAITWGDGRLLGAADWSPTGRSLDAVRAHAPIGVVDVEAFAAILDSPAPLGQSAGDTFGPTRAGAELYGALAAWPIDPLLRVEVLALARVSRGADLGLDVSRFSVARDEGETYTGSVRAAGDAKGWKYAVEGAYQLGTASAVVFGPGGADRSAFALAAYVQRRFDAAALAPTARIGGSYASGDDGGGTYKQFDPILPDVHTWHGAMDMFAWSNLVEGHASVAVTPWTDTTFAVQYRYARLANSRGEWINGWLAAVGTGPQPMSEDLGHEIDLDARWRPWIPFELAAGYSLLYLGDAARGIMASEGRGAAGVASFSPADFSHFAYLQATASIP